MKALSSRQQLFDGLAIGASFICLIHCLALPLLIMLLPALAAYMVVPDSFHVWALVFAAPVSLLALSAGYRRHRGANPLLIALPGLALMAIGALAAPSQWMETALTVPGVLLLAIGHALNWHKLRLAGQIRS
ncbi:hypothetical protein J3E64_002944 [Sphingobium sp. OAS761]|uniref:MerC domain-containing protein n=1 Tax=Sphingobium sp. OAS761 TaxID=2817901 RepID=UPI0020A0C3D2|nr:MerC domain-containing protein [Sphingobium sp. OAS761]MCP1471240.1 hypothetical protein [Sphingobium sp. OAS761]